MTHQGKASGRRRLRGAVGAAGMAAALLAASGPPTPAASKADPRAGKEQYDRLCAVCHGGEGKGDGQALRGLPVRPKSFAEPATFRAVPDQALFETIKKGGAALKKSPMMPPFGDQLKDAQIWDLVAYIKSLAPPAR
jgi:mono/diheme cytochrome c family protein